MERDEILLQSIGDQAQIPLFQQIIHVQQKIWTPQTQGESSRGAASEQNYGLPLGKTLQPTT